MGAINPDEIISILKEEIKNYDEISKDQEVGTVISVGDGIATVYGIDHAMYGEVVTFENGLKGMVQDVRANSMERERSRQRNTARSRTRLLESSTVSL